jgi:excisionase family DNA binding protein
MDRLLTPETVAVLLAVPKRAIYGLAATGEIPGAIRIGRRLRFDRRLIRTWLRIHRRAEISRRRSP